MIFSIPPSSSPVPQRGVLSLPFSSAAGVEPVPAGDCENLHIAYWIIAELYISSLKKINNEK